MANWLITFGWVWGVCFLATWGLASFIKLAENQSDLSNWYLGAISLLISLPIGVILTIILSIFRILTVGTEYERKLNKAKGLRIGTISLLVAIGGFAEAVAFGTGIGQVVFFLAFVGMLVGGAVHIYEMFKEYNT